MKETKQRLLQTAAEMFAEHGIDGVSTRDLAKASGVNLCSINYYFGTKQNLYDAVLEDVIEKIIYRA
jgi:AcrR family transcriptional regulator